MSSSSSSYPYMCIYTLFTHMSAYDLGTLPYVDFCVFIAIFCFYFWCFMDAQDWAQAYIT